MQNFSIKIFNQTQETPIHYCARAGNADVMLEIVKHLGPNQVQVAVNKQAKVRLPFPKMKKKHVLFI